MNPDPGESPILNDMKTVIQFPDVQSNVFEFLRLQEVQDVDRKNLTLKVVRGHRHNQHRFARTGVPNVINEIRMMTAASTNNLERVELQLKNGVNPNAQDHYKRTALHLAASHGYVEVASLLLRYGADPNVSDTLGNLPLHLACCQGSGKNAIVLIKHLLEAGTNVQILNKNGNNPLDLAKSKLRMLISRSISGNPDESRSIIADFINIVELMLKYKCKTMHNDNVDDLTSLCTRIASLTTKEDAHDELSSLLNQL